jgi:hypothetical protein
MKTPNCTEHLNKQEDISRRKEVKEEEAGSRNSSTDSVNSGSEPAYQIYVLLRWALW